MMLDEDLAALSAPVKSEIADLSALRGKVALAMPLGKDGPPPTAYVSWSQFLVAAERHIGNVSLCQAYRMPIVATRTMIAEMFLASHCEWLFSVDYDMVFDPEIALRLLQDAIEHPKIKFVSGTARMGGAPHRPALYQKAGDTWRPLMTWPKETLFSVDRVGLFGFVAHRSLFEALETPWYSGIDECWWFCDRARAAGVELMVDPRAPFGHIGERIIPGTPDSFE